MQILKYWGYSNIIATASPKHHDKIKAYGATQVFDYRDSRVVESIREYIEASTPSTPLRVFDCVDSKTGSVLLISKIATQSGTIVAAVLPVVVSNASSPDQLQISGDLASAAEWAQGVTIHPIVTYTYEAVST